MVALRAFIAAAKFLWGDEDEEDDTERPYANVPIVRQLERSTRTLKTPQPGPLDVRKMAILDQYIDLVRSLKTSAPRLHDGGARSDSAAESAAISHLVCCRVPDRQRTIRQLEIGRRSSRNPRKTPATGKRARREGERRLSTRVWRS